MKKYKLSLILGTVFLSFLILLTYEMLSAYWKFLPFAMIASLIVITLGLLWDFKRTGKSAHEAYAPRHFAQIATFTLITIAITLMFAILLHKKHFSKKFDLTTNKIHSLNTQTVDFVKAMNQNVQIICVPGQNVTDNYCDSVNDLINLYEKNSKEIINLGTLDLTDRTMLSKIQPSGFSRLILMSDTNKSEVTGQITENKLTNALINLIKTKKIVYFLTGHGEPSLMASNSEKSYSDIATQLDAKAYYTQSLNLQNTTIPSDAQLLVAGDNSIAYNTNVETQLMDYVARGGKLILINNPYRTQGLDRLYKLLNLQPDDVLLTLNKETALGRQIAKQNLLRPPVIMSDFNPDSPITMPIVINYGADASIPIDGARPFTLLDSENALIKTDTEILMSVVEAAPVTLTKEQRNQIDLKAPFLLEPDTEFDSDQTWPVGFDIQIANASKLSNTIQAPENAENDTTEVVIYGFSLVNEYSQSMRITEELLPLSIAKLYQDKEFLNIPSKSFAPKQFNLSKNPGAFVPLFAGLLPVCTAMIGVLIWFRRRHA